MAKLSAREILAKNDLPERDVEVPEWGTTIRLRALSGAGWDRYRQEFTVYDEDGTPKLKPNGDLMTVDDQRPERSFARLVLHCAVDDAGAPLFTADDLEALAEKNRAVLRRLAAACNELSATTPQQLDDAAKNSPAPSDG